MALKWLSLILFVLSLPFPVFYETSRDVAYPGVTLLLLGFFGFSHLRPAWVTISWFANVTFVSSLQPARTEAARKSTRLYAVVGVVLALLFLIAASLGLTFKQGDTIAASRWSEIRLSYAYFLWLMAQITVALHVFLAPQPPDDRQVPE